MKSNLQIYIEMGRMSMLRFTYAGPDIQMIPPVDCHGESELILQPQI